MTKLPDFYQLLHVQHDAPAAVVKASYRAMMQKMQYHPDLGGDEATAQRLNEAVATLCNPIKRAIYDVEFALQAKQQSMNSQNAVQPANSGANNENVETSEPNQESAQNKKCDAKDHKRDSRDTAKNKSEQVTETFIEPSVSSFPNKSRCPFCSASYLLPAITAPAAYARKPRCNRCLGAITPISFFETIDQGELRKIHRYHHVTAGQLWQRWPMADPLTVTMSDLSPAGCAIESTDEIALDSIVLLDTELLNAICKIRYCKQLSTNDEFAVGLEFLTLALYSVPGAIFSSSA